MAAAYAFAGYATDAVHVSNDQTVSTNRTTTGASVGIKNAFATASNLATLATGAALATTPAVNGGNGVVPQQEINTLANILSTCINSPSASSAGCNTLLSNATNGATVPTDTATAAINIAHNPGVNIGALYSLQTPQSPFQTALTAQPNDFTMPITFTGGGVNQPFGIAIDSAGGVWTANQGNNSLGYLSSLGLPKSGSTGFTGGGLSQPRNIAIDLSDHAWATNYLSATVSKFSSAGAISGSAGYTGGGLNSAVGIAIDGTGTGNVWITNNNNAILSKLSGQDGSAISGTGGYPGGGLDAPISTAIDGSGNVWVANNFGPSGSINNAISKFNGSTGAAISGSSGYTGGGLNQSYSIAIDAAGNAWVANIGNKSISEFSGSTGVAIAGASGFTGGGLAGPESIAIDGAGNPWVMNSNGGSVAPYYGSVSNFNGSTGVAISGTTGYLPGIVASPVGVAIDGSGNVWMANVGGNSITEMVGAASPIVVPLALGVFYNKLGTRP